jgi:putative ABC transport system substrate-binding protein
VKRRAFFTVLGGAAAWPLAARAQQPERVPRVGVLMAFSKNDPVAQAGVTAFSQALGRLGWVEGQNIGIDYRFAEGDPTLLKTYASELAGLSPRAILASPQPAAVALRQPTTVPVVVVFAVDPVGIGLVESLARPGGNITGFGAIEPPLMGKWPQLLKEVASNVTRVAVIFNPGTTTPKAFNTAIEAAAPSFGMSVTLAPVQDDAGIEEDIAAHARDPGGGLIILPDAFTTTHRDVIVASALRYNLPLIGIETFPRTGGLLSYWYDTVDVYAQAANYIDRILRGDSPADLPVQQPTKYSLIINLKTAEALGLTVPPSMLDLADEVIE